MREQVIITGQAAAAVFSSTRQRKIVQTLMGKEMALGALASATHLPISLLHYHVTKCMELGLIEVVREQRRAGRAIKHYRATAASFFVPAELILEMPGTKLNQQMRMLLDQNLARSLQGLDFTHDGYSPRAHLVKETEERAAATELWLDVELGATDAEQLAADLQAVIDRFRARRKPHEPRYLVHLAAVRL